MALGMYMVTGSVHMQQHMLLAQLSRWAPSSRPSQTPQTCD
jgi:hypothetical protein